MVIGHRGSGMNILQSCDPRMKSIQENSILSFNAASKFPIDFIEFDVQVFPFFFFFFFKCSCLVSKKRKMCSRFKNSKIKLCSVNSVNSGKNILNTFIIRSIRVKFQDFSYFFVSYAVQQYKIVSICLNSPRTNLDLAWPRVWTVPRVVFCFYRSFYYHFLFF